MVALAFHDDGGSDLMRGLWDHLIRAYGVSEVYVVGPASARWKPIESLDDAPGDRWFITPRFAELAPGEVSLFDARTRPDVTLCFGSDEHHNPPVYGARALFIPTPRDVPLYAVQAAHAALEHWRSRGDL